MTHLRGALAVLATAAAVNMGVVSAPAGAVELVPGASATAPPITPEQHCTLNIDTMKSQCFDTYAQVTRALSAGTVSLNEPRRLTDAIVRQMSAASGAAGVAARPADILSDVVIGVVYENAGWAGSTYTFTTANPDGCSPHPAQYKVTPMPSGWNDRISAFKSYSHCRTTLYENPNFGGATEGPADDETIGAKYMNDRASSIIYQR